MVGVKRYFTEVYNNLATENQLITPSKNIKKYPVLTGHLWEQLYLPCKVPNKSLLWSPANIGPICYTNQIVTIHDWATIDNPQWFNKSFAQLYSYVLPSLVKNCKHIITMSDFSKEAIIKHTRCADSKVSVIHNGINSIFSQQQSSMDRNNISEQIINIVSDINQYILFLGSIEPRKNLTGLVKAWRLWSKRPQNLKLLVVGDKGHVFKNIDLKIMEDDNVIFLGRVSDDEIVYIYQNAIFSVYPSFYEGFGLPPLESMACGTPVITSNTSALPEIIGDAAIMIDPYNISELVDAIDTLYYDKALRDKLSIKGLLHCKKFSWECSARSHEVIFNQFI